MPALVVEDLHVHYGAIHAVRGVSFTVESGEIVSIVGSNGAGKSTIMWTLARVVPLTGGTILLEGSPLPDLPHLVVERGVALVPERRRLFSALSVRENLAMGAYKRKDPEGAARDMERCFALFPILKQRLSQLAGTLSGGEQQMLAISRALMSSPRVLLLDEPSLGLAPMIVETLMETILKIRDEGMTVLLVEQNAAQAIDISDRGYIMETGRIVKSGTGRELSDDPDIRRVYLGG